MKGSTKPKEVWHIHQSKNERSSIKEDSEMSSDDTIILKSFAKGTPYHKKIKKMKGNNACPWDTHRKDTVLIYNDEKN